MTMGADFLTGQDILDLFETEEPQAIFSAALQGLGQPQRRFFENQFSKIHNQYLGQLAQQAAASPEAGFGPGGIQQQTFQQFLQDVPFTRRFASLAPSLKGFQTGRFAPQTRFSF